MIETVTSDLKVLRSKDKKPARVLVTGATGYVGGRLVRELVAHKYRVRVLVRDAHKLQDYPWRDQVEIVEGDALDPEALNIALQGIDLAYYMLHALMVSKNFEQMEEDLARNFGKLAMQNGVKRIVYLGGITSSDDSLSPHMSARAKTGEILRSSGVPTIELRAGVVIGSGSASFEMLRHLTERLPIMVTPKWLKNRIQPIAVRDVLRYLIGSATIDKKINDVFDIGGPDVFTYMEMMQIYAEVAGLRRRIILPLPVLTPRLASGWIGLVTPVPVTLAKRLVASLKHEVVAKDDRIRELVPDHKDGLTDFRKSVSLALTRIKELNVETRWSNALTPGTHSQPLPTDPDWAGGSLYVDLRQYESDDSQAEIWKRVESIGGQNGYSTATWAWELRGLMDRVVGGVGLRRGRRDPNKLREGEALDFWRVEEIQRPKLLRLRAEMKMPGLAWLEFKVGETPEGKSLVTQRALYHPRGLFGHVYWWMVFPMHGIVFPSMAKKMAGPSAKKYVEHYSFSVSKTRLAVIALLGVGFTWGAAFVLMKDAIEQQPYMDFLATRFTIAAIAMVLLRPKVALAFKTGDIGFGGLIGVVLAFGYITQTIGLELTTAATSGFLTGLYVILTPLIAWLFVRQKVSKRVVVGLTMAMLGLGIFSGAAADIEFQVGQIWLVVCAVLYAVHILLLGHYGKGRSSYRFAMLQITFAAIVTWGFALLDGYQPPPNAEVWFAILFTALLSTVLAFWVQTWAQTLIEPSRVALLITSEVVFTAIIAVFVGQEPLTLAIIFGGGLLFAAMLVVEWPSKRPETPLEPQLHE